MPGSRIVPDSIQRVKRPVGLDQRTLRSVKAGAVYCFRFDDPGAIHKAGGSVEARVERSQRVVKAPCPARPIPVGLINGSVSTIAETVGPRFSDLELRPVK